jgi:hypothetical protein
LSILASVLICEHAYEVHEEVIDFLKQMGIHTGSDDPWTNVMFIGRMGVRYPNGVPIYDPEWDEDKEPEEIAQP